MKRTPMQSVVVMRDGKSMSPPIGKPFDFTEDEVAQLEATNPDAISSEAVVDLDKEEKSAAKKSAAKKDDL